MKPVVVVTVLLVVAVAFLGVRGAASGHKGRPSRSPDATYLGLRDLALGTKASDIGLNPGNADEPYGVVMDIEVDGGTATITSFGTGDASLYLSTGGGTIGSGQSSEEVAAAARQFVAAAKSYLSAMAKVSTQPLPGPGEVIFYVLTPDGVHAATRPQQDLGEGKDGLSPLFYAGQDVLTQIRMAEERQDRERQQQN